MNNFYLNVIVKNPRFRSQKRINDMRLLEPVTRQKITALLADARAYGINLMVYETYRSQERQGVLFNHGMTQLKMVDAHHFGLACDLVKDVDGEPCWKGDFSLLSALGKEYGLIWGGDWGHSAGVHSFVDPCHLQRCSVGRQASLFNLQWYPDASYDPYVQRHTKTATFGLSAVQSLDPISTDSGCLERLILAEALGPQSPGYDFDQAQTAVLAMIAVLQNRVALNQPSTFCAPAGSDTKIDYIAAACAGGSAQFRGFSLDDQGNVVIAAPQQQVIDNIYNAAQSGTDQDIIDFVNMIIGYCNSSVLDPFAGLTTVGGQPVYPGAYGWQTTGASGQMGTMVAIPADNTPSGIIQGQQFYALLQP